MLFCYDLHIELPFDKRVCKLSCIVTYFALDFNLQQEAYDIISLQNQTTTGEFCVNKTKITEWI